MAYSSASIPCSARADVNAAAGSTTLYVLNRAGRCLAASDADEPGTPFGADLSFRPYLKDALTFGHGRFYGVGITSRVPGYYMSYALSSGGEHFDAQGNFFDKYHDRRVRYQQAPMMRVNP